MYGDSTLEDVFREQVALEYKTFFKDAFRKLPQNIPGANKYELWEMASTMFTVSEIYGILIYKIKMILSSIVCFGKQMLLKVIYKL